MSKRLITVALLIAIPLLAGTVTAYSQDKGNVVTVSVSGKTIKSVIKQLETETGWRFFYSDDMASLDKSVSFSCKDLPLDKALEKLLAGSGISYKMSADRTVVLTPFSNAAQQSVRGDVQVSLKKSRITVKELAKIISESTGSRVFYDPDQVDPSYSIPTQPGDCSLGSLLSQTPYESSTVGKAVYIAKKTEGKIPSSISGRIVYDDGAPMAGATVIVAGTDKGTVTDNAGRYRLSVPSGAKVLTAMFMGSKDRTVQIVPASAQPDIVMQEESTVLDEVVFVGYSTMSKRDVLGSITSLRADEMKTNSSGGDVLTAMKGKIAGMNIVANSGEPGAGSDVTLRGAASISGSGSPLYIIDGVPMEVDNVSSMSGDASFSPLANINLSDIASVEVLKDAASAAIYGSRAANGVVIITTKGGELGNMEPTVNFSHVSTVASLYRKIDVMNADEFRSAFTDAQYAYKGELPTNDWLTNARHPYYAQSIDWQDYLFKTSYQTKNNLSVRGANQKFSYNISLGYKDEAPIVIATKYKQYNVNGKFTYVITPWLKGGTNVYYTNTDYNRIISSSSNNLSALRAALVTNPSMSPYDPITGELLDWLGTSSQGGRNPIAVALKTPYNYKTEWTMMSQWLELKLAKDLSVRSTVSIDKTSQKHDYYRTRELASNLSANQIDLHQYSQAQKKNVVVENVLNWSKKLNKNSLSSTLGQSFQINDSETISLYGEDYIDSSIIPIQSAKEQSTINQDIQQRRMLSFFGRLNYNYDGRYLASVVLRADGSSRFGPGKRFGYFPSASLGWRFSKEPFLEFLSPVLTDGKLRLSYGVTGNQNVGNYSWRGSFASSDDSYNGNLAILQTALQNDELGWETTTQKNIGLDLNFLKDRIVFSADAYHKVSDDLLFSFPLNYYTGFSSVSRNYGSIENKGLEFCLNTINVSKKQFSWRTDFNIAFNRNKILSIPEDTDFIIGSYSLGRVGEAAGVFYAHKALGVYANTKDNIWYGSDGTVREVRKGSVNGDAFQGGDVIWADLDNNGIIDDADRTIIGSPHPKFFGGIGNTVSYGPFSVRFHFDFTYGNKIMNELRRSRNKLSTSTNLGADALNRWRNEGDITDFPRLVYADKMDNFRPSTLTMEDGSFLRLSNVSLNYSIPAKVLSKIKLKSANVYVSGTNLLIWSRYSGYDPEISSSLNPFQKGIDNGSFPKARTANVGIDISF